MSSCWEDSTSSHSERDLADKIRTSRWRSRIAVLAARAFQFLILPNDLGFVATVSVIGELEEDQAKNRRRIFAGFEIRVCPEIIGSAPEVFFQLFQLFFGHVLSINRRPTRSRSSRSAFCEPVLLEYLSPWKAFRKIRYCGDFTRMGGGLPRAKNAVDTMAPRWSSNDACLYVRQLRVFRQLGLHVIPRAAH